MSKIPLTRALLDAQLRLTLIKLTWDERNELCKHLAHLMERETAQCNTVEQLTWLVAKAWSTAAGKEKGKYRSSGPRDKTSHDRIRIILAEVPIGK